MQWMRELLWPFCGKKKNGVSRWTYLFARSSILRNDLSRLSANCTFPASVNSHVANHTNSTRTIRVIIMASLTLNLILMSGVQPCQTDQMNHYIKKMIPMKSSISTLSEIKLFKISSAVAYNAYSLHGQTVIVIVIVLSLSPKHNCCYYTRAVCRQAFLSQCW